MARTRLAVALLVPAPFDTEIDGVRRALGDRRRERIAPHITLVPPVNVGRDDVGSVLRLLRDTAAAQAAGGPIELNLGPVATFSPSSGIAYLAIGGSDAELERLRDLRAAVACGPLHRGGGRPFVAHVTVADRLEPEQIAATIDVLAHYRVRIAFDRLHLLEHRHGGAGPRWVPVADLAFVEPAIVGRGGVELALTTSRLADPEGRELLAGLGVLVAPDAGVATTSDRPDRVGPGTGVPDGAEPVVVTARQADRVVGLGWGWYHGTLAGEVDGVVVAPDMRGQGIGRQVRLGLEAHLAG